MILSCSFKSGLVFYNLAGALKLILLDEVSMVGNGMFTVQLSNRLKDLKSSNEDFGGVSIITIGDLFQLKPVMDGYVFNDVQCLNSYNNLAPNLWRKYFRMYELHEIMLQRESKMFAEILNRLREGNHTPSDLQTLKERCTTIKFTNHSIVLINTRSKLKIALLVHVQLNLKRR